MSFRVYIGFYPVKLRFPENKNQKKYFLIFFTFRTFVGEPIEYDENRSVEELVDLV